MQVTQLHHMIQDIGTRNESISMARMVHKVTKSRSIRDDHMPKKQQQKFHPFEVI
jgi:hypothetical protein